MIKKVLIVDDDQEMLLALNDGLEKYNETFSVLGAGDGIEAMEKLKHHSVSLVVTDLKMPVVDGFSLLTHVMEYYPGIPVIVITGRGSPEMERLASEGGAVGYIEKPFMINNLAKQIMETLRKESDGGSLHNVSSGMFLQLMEMEQKTCTIRIYEKKSGRQGVLFFKEGELMNARLNNLDGEKAASRIFSWDEVNISIQNGCLQSRKVIKKDMQAILLDSMRIKDEVEAKDKNRSSSNEDACALPLADVDAPLEEKSSLSENIEKIKRRLQIAAGERCGMEDVYYDDSWNDLVENLKRFGEIFDAGSFKLSYIDKGDAEDFILLPGERTTVITVNPKCPRDMLVQALTNE